MNPYVTRRCCQRYLVWQRNLGPISDNLVILSGRPFQILYWKLGQYRLAKEIGVSPRRINEIVHGKRAVSADTALRLSRNFGMSERFWINLQGRYEIEVEKDLLADLLDSEVRSRVAVG
jgi:addiction module HigA family antidote